MKKETQVQPRGADGAEKVSALFGQRSGNQKPLQTQDGVSAQAEPDTGTGESDGQPSYVTRAEMERIKAEAVAEARRTAQQISDKAASTSQKAYQEAMRRIEQLKEAGVKVSPDAEKKLRDEYMQEAEKEPSRKFNRPRGKQPPQTKVPQPAQTALKPPAWLDRRVGSLVEQTGFALRPTDPEFSEAGLSTQLMKSDPMGFYEKYASALQTKAERISKRQRQPSRGMTPGMGTGGNAMGLEASYKKEFLAARGNARKQREIRARYQQKGLNTSRVKFGV